MIPIQVLQLFAYLKEGIAFCIEDSYFRSDLFVDVGDCCSDGDAVIVFAEWDLEAIQAADDTIDSTEFFGVYSILRHCSIGY